MKIAFNTPILSQKDMELFQAIGCQIQFNPNAYTEKYKMELPNNFHFHLISQHNDTLQYVFYNGIQILHLNKYLDGWVNSECLEKLVQSPDEFTENDSKEFIEQNYDNRLRKQLYQLASIFLGTGAQSGYSPWIEPYLHSLFMLKRENIALHDVIINSNECYKEMERMTPNWHAPYGFVDKFKAQDVGAVAAYVGRVNSRRDTSALMTSLYPSATYAATTNLDEAIENAGARNIKFRSAGK